MNILLAIRQRRFRVFFSGKLHYLISISALLFLFGLARPQIAAENSHKKEGCAIALAIDCSSTMLAEDMSFKNYGLRRFEDIADKKKKINRMEAVKKVAAEFISGRHSDSIGIIGFAGEAYMVSPLTFDKKWLLHSINRLDVGLIKDGTAIGSGILCALNSLKRSVSRTKIVILLSDGINNSGTVPPMLAAETARSMGVKIYSIGISSDGPSQYPEKSENGKIIYRTANIPLNEKMLKDIASRTGGEYYRATDLSSLKKTYDTIDRMERVPIDDNLTGRYADIYQWPVTFGFLCLLAYILLSNTFFRELP